MTCFSSRSATDYVAVVVPYIFHYLSRFCVNEINIRFNLTIGEMSAVRAAAVKTFQVLLKTKTLLYVKLHMLTLLHYNVFLKNTSKFPEFPPKRTHWCGFSRISHYELSFDLQ